MRILLFKSFFIPSSSFIETNLNSIDNFIRYFKTVNIEGKLIVKLVGWISSDISKKDRVMIKEKLRLMSLNMNSPQLNPRNLSNSINIAGKQALPKLTISMETEIWGKNYGKIHLLKNIGIIYPMYRLCNFIIYADHDISPIDNIFTDRVMLDNYVNDRKIKLVSFDQYPDNRHSPFIYRHQVETINGKYYYCQDNIHIASGCFIIKPDVVPIFKELNSKSVYGEEDIAIGKILNKRGYQNLVSALKVNHPYGDDEEYEKWKKDLIKSIVIEGLDTTMPSDQDDENKNSDKLLP